MDLFCATHSIRIHLVPSKRYMASSVYMSVLTTGHWACEAHEIVMFVSKKMSNDAVTLQSSLAIIVLVSNHPIFAKLSATMSLPCFQYFGIEHN